jgi:hypothetical protein
MAVGDTGGREKGYKHVDPFAPEYEQLNMHGEQSAR